MLRPVGSGHKNGCAANHNIPTRSGILVLQDGEDVKWDVWLVAAAGVCATEPSLWVAVLYFSATRLGETEETVMDAPNLRLLRRPFHAFS